MHRIAGALLVAAHVLVDCAGAQVVDRPRVGLVLSGSGELSVANVGALLELEELRIPFDVIVGTGMGAVIGGSYAAGTRATELERMFTQTRWDRFLADAPIQEYFSAPAPAGEGAARGSPSIGSLVLGSPGAVSGRNLDLLLQSLFAGAYNRGVRSFEQLPIPFTSISSDLETGESVIFRHGDFVSILRPNMMAMNPAVAIEMDGRLISDVPWITRPRAFGAARNMGADVVLFVNVSAQIIPSGEAPPDLVLAYRMLDLAIADADRAAMALTDVVIMPDLFGLEPGTSVPEIIRRGREAVRALSDVLAPLSLDESQYQAWRDRVRGLR